MGILNEETRCICEYNFNRSHAFSHSMLADRAEFIYIYHMDSGICHTRSLPFHMR